MDNEHKLVQVEKDFYKSFECSVCREFMSAPIFLCVTGHSICSSCREQVETCPICTEQFSLARNYSLEHVIEGITFPCKNFDFGCEDVVYLKNKDEHEKFCPHRLYDCLPGMAVGCQWKGKKVDIFTHVKNNHKHACTNHAKKMYIILQNFHMDKDRKSYHIISVHGEIFWLQAIISSTQKTLYISVHYIGQMQNCSKYLYTVRCISLTNSKHEIVFTTETHPDNVQIKDLQDKIPCFYLKDNMAKYFIDNNRAFKMELELMEQSPNINILSYATFMLVGIGILSVIQLLPIIFDINI